MRVLLAVVPVAFTALFFAWPLGAILGRGLRASAIGDALGDAHVRGVLWFTLWQALACTGLALLVGIAPAYVLARYRLPGRRLLLALVTVPFMLPTVVVGSAFVDEIAAGGKAEAADRVLRKVRLLSDAVRSAREKEGTRA